MVASSNSGIAVTLVHGTWGRGMFPGLFPRLSSRPCWFEEKSVFRTQLHTLLSAEDRPVVIQEFHWSGSNSLAARQSAAAALSSKLAETKLQFPEYAHAVVGHSHGGNVALAALSNLGDAGATWLLVALATPFLSIKDVDLKSPLLNKLDFFFYAAYSLILWQIFVLFRSDPPPDQSYQIIASICTNVVSVAIAWILAIGWRTELVSSKSDEVQTSASVLVLRSIDDEANLALLAGSIVSKLSYFVLSLIYFLANGIQIIMGAWLVSLVAAAAAIELHPVPKTPS
jgi:hypothetical protein